MFFKQFFNTTISPPAAPAFPTDGLVARWTFDDTLVDTENSLTLSGVNVSYASGGRVGKCLDFSAANSYAYIRNNTVSAIFTNQATHTVSLWVKFGDVIASYDAQLFGVGSSGSCGYTHYAGNINNSEQVFMQRGTHCNGSSYRLTTLSSSLSQNTWHHVVFIYDNKNMKVYIDNGTALTATDTGINLEATSYFTLGRFHFTTGRDDYRGYMDQVYLYNRALSAPEISQLYNSGNGI